MTNDGTRARMAFDRSEQLAKLLPLGMERYDTLRDSIQFEKDYGDGFYAEIEVYANTYALLLMDDNGDVLIERDETSESVVIDWIRSIDAIHG